MNLYKSKTYIEDVKKAIKSTVNFEHLYEKSIMITGASGLIGSYIVDMCILANKSGANIMIYAIGRDIESLEARFADVKTDNLCCLKQDVNEEFRYDIQVDYIIHAASNAYPAIFSADPVGTIITNIHGTKNLLDYGYGHGVKRFMYISSGEVYGQGDLSLKSFDEGYSGVVNSVEVRSCYPSSKRTAETLCVSYAKQFGMDTIIARLSHTYGPNATTKDNRASVQFVNKALNGENIVLKSTGSQERSYTYIGDAASAVLTILLNGKSCEAYNVAYKSSIITIAEFAKEIARQTKVEVSFAEMTIAEKKGMTPILKQVLNSEKLEKLGWRGMYNVEEGIAHTLATIKEAR